MCNAWQSLGLWLLTGLAFLTGLGAGTPFGWLAHSVRQWHLRTMIDVKKLGPVFRMAGVGMVFLVIAGFVVYGWMVM